MKPTEGYDIIENFGMNKPTEEKTFLRILVDSNRNTKLYDFEQWDGGIVYRGIEYRGIFKRTQYSTHNKALSIPPYHLSFIMIIQYMMCQKWYIVISKAPSTIFFLFQFYFHMK